MLENNIFRRILFKEKENKEMKPFTADFGNGLKFEAKIKNKEPVFEFINKNGEIFDLKKLAPENTEFRYKPGKWEACDNESDKPYINYSDFKNIEDILSLLHEIGHLVNKELGNKARQAYHEFEKEKQKANTYGQSKSWLKALQNKKQAYLKMEKAAWQYAIDILKWTEKKFSAEILNCFGSEDKLKKIIEKNLNIYIQSFIDELDEKGIKTEENFDQFLSFYLGETDASAQGQKEINKF